MTKFARVLLEVSNLKPLDYKLPEELASSIQVGSLVEVPLRGSLRKGVVSEIVSSSPFPNVQPIHKVISDQTLSQDLMKLADWISSYFATPLNKVLQTMIPASVRHETKKKEAK